MNLFSFELASRLWSATSNEEAKSAKLGRRDTFEQAAEALYRIGLRWRDKAEIRSDWRRTDMAARVGKLAGRAVADITRRHGPRMMKAEQDVRDYWRRGGKPHDHRRRVAVASG